MQLPGKEEKDCISWHWGREEGRGQDAAARTGVHFMQQALAGVVPTAITACPGPSSASETRWEISRVFQGE